MHDDASPPSHAVLSWRDPATGRRVRETFAIPEVGLFLGSANGLPGTSGLFVSRTHLHLFCRDGFVWAADAASRNGTTLRRDGRAEPLISARAVRRHDRLLLGDLELTVEACAGALGSTALRWPVAAVLDTAFRELAVRSGVGDARTTPLNPFDTHILRQLAVRDEHRRYLPVPLDENPPGQPRATKEAARKRRHDAKQKLWAALAPHLAGRPEADGLTEDTLFDSHHGHVRLRLDGLVLIEVTGDER